MPNYDALVFMKNPIIRRAFGIIIFLNLLDSATKLNYSFYSILDQSHSNFVNEVQFACVEIFPDKNSAIIPVL